MVHISENLELGRALLNKVIVPGFGRIEKMVCRSVCVQFRPARRKRTCSECSIRRNHMNLDRIRGLIPGVCIHQVRCISRFDRVWDGAGSYSVDSSRCIAEQVVEWRGFVFMRPILAGSLPGDSAGLLVLPIPMRITESGGALIEWTGPGNICSTAPGKELPSPGVDELGFRAMLFYG